MTRYMKPKYASRDAKLGAWTYCDDCGFIDNQSHMAFQYDYQGGSVPTNTGYLKCPRCMDALNYQRKLIIIPPDPPPLMNTRPGNNAVDETNWLTTQDGDIFETVTTDEEYITSIPNPAQNAATSVLASRIVYPAGSVATVYLDLYDGNPASIGSSVLALITGSATRTNIAADLTTTNDVATNAEPIVMAASSANTVNVSYVAIFDAATGGNLLASGLVSASPTVAQGNAVQFDALTLSIDIS